MVLSFCLLDRFQVTFVSVSIVSDIEHVIFFFSLGIITFSEYLFLLTILTSKSEKN